MNASGTAKKTRQQLEDIWRERLRVYHLNYLSAQAEFQATYEQHLDNIAAGLTSDPSFAIRKARQRESAALKKYMKTLRTFTSLVLHGKLPAEE